MVSVDDLIISLRIDETSNLGKLQKQLESLIGTRGEKPLDISVDPSLKRDLSFIKSQISFLSPQIIPTTKEYKTLAETLYKDKKTIEKNFETISSRLISERTDALTSQMQEYDAENRSELLEKMKEVLGNFIGMMELGAAEKLPAEVMQRIDSVAKELISKQQLAEGDRKVLIEKIEKSIGELNTLFSRLLTGTGIVHKPEFTVYKIREKWYKDLGLDPKTVRFSVSDLLGKNEDVIKEFSKIQGLLAFKKQDLYDFINSAIERLQITPSKEMFTTRKIEQEPKLKALATGIFMKAYGTKYGIPTGFHKVIQNMLEKNVGISTKKIYEKSRPDFLLINNSIDDLKKLFNEKVSEILAKPISFIELKSILSESNKEQFQRYKELIGEKHLAGIASLVKQSFKDYFPEIMTDMVSIISELKELEPEKFLTEHELRILSETRMEKEIPYEILEKGLNELATRVGLDRRQKEYFNMILNDIKKSKEDLSDKIDDVQTSVEKREPPTNEPKVEKEGED